MARKVSHRLFKSWLHVYWLWSVKEWHCHVLESDSKGHGCTLSNTYWKLDKQQLYGGDQEVMRHSCPLSTHENLEKRTQLAIPLGDISVTLKTVFPAIRWIRSKEDRVADEWGWAITFKEMEEGNATKQATWKIRELILETKGEL